MKKEKLIISNLENSLIHSAEASFFTYCEAIKDFPHDIDPIYENFLPIYGKGYYRIIKSFLPEITNEEVEEVKKRFMSLYDKYIDHVHLDENIYDLLISLSTSHNIALFTNASKRLTHKLLIHFKIKDNFDFILTHDDVLYPKPHTDGYERILEHFQVHKGDVLAIEGTLDGYQSATKAGLKVIFAGDINFE